MGIVGSEGRVMSTSPGVREDNPHDPKQLAALMAECYDLEELEREATWPQPPLRQLTDADVSRLMADRLDELRPRLP